MNKIKIAIVTLVMSLLATGCFGPAKVTTPDKTPTGISQLNIVINRPVSMSLMSVSPQDHDEREHFLRVMAWSQGNFDSPSVKVMKDIPVEDHQNGQVTVELKLPLRFGYRVMAVEWVERDGIEIGSLTSAGEPVYIGVTEPVDVLSSEPVVVTINMNSVEANPPTMYVQNPVETGAERILGTVTIPHNFKLGSFGFEYVNSSGGINAEDECRRMLRHTGSQHIDTIPPVRVNWHMTTPILQQDTPISCTFRAHVEILDVRPPNLDAYPLMYFWTEPTMVTITPPDGGIGF